MRHIVPDEVNFFTNLVCLPFLVRFALGHQLVDELSGLFHVALSLILKRLHLILELVHLIYSVLSITVSPLGHLFHRLEVVLPPLVLHLVDRKFDLRCRILL